jgi:hypothetical protein
LSGGGGDAGYVRVVTRQDPDAHDAIARSRTSSGSCAACLSSTTGGRRRAARRCATRWRRRRRRRPLHTCLVERRLGVAVIRRRLCVVTRSERFRLDGDPSLLSLCESGSAQQPCVFLTRAPRRPHATVGAAFSSTASARCARLADLCDNMAVTF